MIQVLLYTYTTGLATAHGHRIIEIGCLELVNRRVTGRQFHKFLNPDRDIDAGAEQVHGISRADLETAPRFPEVVDEFLDFLAGSELVIHNADFDVGFIEHELSLMKHAQPAIREHASVLDTLTLARRMHPGQRNSLDALCKRYEVDASNRELHGALVDADLLARVYLAMTGGQTALILDTEAEEIVQREQAAAGAEEIEGLDLKVIAATADELKAHEALLDRLRESGNCLFELDSSH
ncbi:MAG: DNA polymerase III subunit epsilon [Pseudomonadota bacterium]